MGKPFDPSLHEALMQQESDAPPGTVVQEMARGFKLHDRLVRPAAVVVSKARGEGAAGAAPAKDAPAGAAADGAGGGNGPGGPTV